VVAAAAAAAAVPAATKAAAAAAAAVPAAAKAAAAATALVEVVQQRPNGSAIVMCSDAIAMIVDGGDGNNSKTLT
jgi:hypothetical protein